MPILERIFLRPPLRALRRLSCTSATLRSGILPRCTRATVRLLVRHPRQDSRASQGHTAEAP